MSKPLIFTISAVWDADASIWSGHCDDFPAPADAPTLDALLEMISVMALDLLPDNHPGVDPTSLFLQITALREAESARAGWRHSSTTHCGSCCAQQVAFWSARARAVTRYGIVRSPSGIFRCQSALLAGTPPTLS